MAEIIIVGAGGFGREVLQWVRDAYRDGQHRIRGFLDANAEALADRELEARILSSPDSYRAQPGEELLLAVGDPAKRRRLRDSLANHGAVFHTLVHPTAYVAPTAQLQPGTIVCPFAYVGPAAVVDQHVAINIYASVGHDAKVGAFSVLSPYATLNGAAVLDDEVFLGTHAIVTVGQHIGHQAKVSAGSVVYREVPPRSLAMGNPAKARPLLPEAE